MRSIFFLVWVAFAGAVRLPPVSGFVLSAFLGGLLLFPLSLFLNISGDDEIGFVGVESAEAMVRNPMFPVWLIGYVLALCIAHLAARQLLRALAGSRA